MCHLIRLSGLQIDISPSKNPPGSSRRICTMSQPRPRGTGNSFCMLKPTRRYSPLRRLTSSSFGGLRPTAVAFFALRVKKELFTLFVLNLGNFQCLVVASLMFSSNLSNIETSQKISNNPTKIKISTEQKLN